MSSAYELMMEKNRYRCGYPKCVSRKSFRDLVRDFVDLNRYIMCPLASPCQNGIQRRHIEQHLRLHGRLLTELSVCNKQYETTFNTISHFVKNHPNESIPYRE